MSSERSAYFLRMIRFQQTQRESLQRDYIFLLQTALSNEEGRLFGGVKVTIEENYSIDLREFF